MPIQISHDKLITISVADTRKSWGWKTKDLLWSDLLQKFSTPHRTTETHAEYMKMKKDRQAEIKDVGGFVGGALAGGRRKKDSVSCRSLITLDVDFPVGDVWQDYIMMYHYAAAVYSTHKHEPEAPRLRVVIPLDREVLADEYEAIARRVAGYLGIEVFDSTTFQPERMMFWPSTSVDGVFDFRYQDGPIMPADEVLATYRDWRDASLWPTALRDFEQVRHNIKKQGDPEQKPGLVGSFCRTYSLEETLNVFLEDVYEPALTENRYTYKAGSTASGMIVYEDKFAYSHHGTDPTSGKLCNAFDLVRIHKFGLLDEDATPGTPVNKLPSYMAMCDLAAKDGNVKLLLFKEKQSAAAADFTFGSSLPEQGVNENGEIVDNDAWAAELDRDSKGNLLQTIRNAKTILACDPMLRGCFALNEFSGRINVMRNIPWRKVDENKCYITDDDEANLRGYMEQLYGMTSRNAIKDALAITISANTYHPIRDYLNNLHWDGVPRVDKLLIKYLGAEDSAYTREVTRKTFVAAVARVMRPGIKFDYMLTLAGPEGKGKSTLIRKLAGEWFSDSFTTVEGTKAMEQIQGCWIVEAGEMKALKRAEVESVKHFVAKQEDIFRPAYGHNVIYPKRQCIFIGTTNDANPLKGENGDRRFWIVYIHVNKPECDIKDDTSLDAEERAQIWAECMELYKAGEKIYLDDSMENIARFKQKEAAEIDDRAGFVTEYLSRKLPVEWEEMNVLERRSWLNDPDPASPGVIERTKVCVAEIYVECFEGKRDSISRYNTRDIHSILNKIDGWTQGKKERFGRLYGPQKAYIKESINSPINITDDELFIN